MKFTGICLITKDVLKLADFYKKVLNVEWDGDATHVELKTEGAGMAIFSVEGMEKMAPGSTEGTGCGSCTIGFDVWDVDSEYERLKVLGVDFVMLPKTHPWGLKSFFFRDPDGNIVVFRSKPKDRE